MSDKEISIFRKEFVKIVKIFLALQNRYLHDDNKVIQYLGLFKEYLSEFNKKYPNFDIILEEADLTSDDLKILLKNYKSKNEIQSRYGLTKIPLMAKMNEKYGCLQALVNYKNMEDETNPSFELICVLGVEKVNKNVKPHLPNELEFISTETTENASSDSRNIVNN